MRKLTASIAAVAAAAAFGFTATSPTLLMEDELGDGNAVNGQGFGDLTGVDPTLNTAPATTSADLVSLKAASLYERVETPVAGTDEVTVTNEVRGLQLRLGTSAPASATDVPTITRIITSIGGCATWFQYYAGTNGQQTSGVANLRLLDGCGLGTDAAGLSNSKTVTPDALTVTTDPETGETVFDLSMEGLPQELVGKLVAGKKITFERAEVRFNSGVITAPVIDQMSAGRVVSFTLGSDVPPAQ